MVNSTAAMQESVPPADQKKHSNPQARVNFYVQWMFAGFVLLVAGARMVWPERAVDYTGGGAWMDAFFTLSLCVFVVSLSWACGLKIIRWFKLADLTQLEMALISLLIGLGVIAYGVLALALTSSLTSGAIAAWLGIVWIFCVREVSQVVLVIVRDVPTQIQAWRRSNKSLETRVLAVTLGLLFLLTLLLALTPPWDVDGLIYHLQVPRTWLQNSGLQPLPHFWEANYPMTIELIYTLGLAFGSDSFSKVIHLVFGVVLLLGVYAAARRTLRPGWAWLAPVILLGIPILPLWASSSYTDLGWAAYEFFSLWVVFEWWRTKQRGYLILGGVLAGFAIGCKYPALAGVGLAGVWVLWQSRKDGLKSALLNGIAFGLPALLIGSPWYLKNLIWFNNPIYPLTFGEQFLPGSTKSYWMAYMWDGFGTGKRWSDYVLIPFNLFAQRERFSTFYGNIEIPSPLFLLVFLYPFIRKEKPLSAIALLSSLRSVVWMVGVQQTRLLLPLFPWLSLLSSAVLIHLIHLPKAGSTWRVLTKGLSGGLVFTTLIYTVLIFLQTSPLGVISGRESKSGFLTRMVSDYASMRYIEEKLSPESRVMLMWDGRGYYCDERCLPDSDHAQWTSLALSEMDVEGVAQRLHAAGVTHLLLGIGDADFIIQHDPHGDHLRALKFFLDEFSPACTRELYRDEWTTLYELSCADS